MSIVSSTVRRMPKKPVSVELELLPAGGDGEHYAKTSVVLRLEVLHEGALSHDGLAQVAAAVSADALVKCGVAAAIDEWAADGSPGTGTREWALALPERAAG